MKRFDMDESGMLECANGDWVRYEDHVEAMTRIAGASPSALTDDWRDQLAALIDIYDDAMNNPPESRTYVDGAFKQQMDEARAMLSATPPAAE